MPVCFAYAKSSFSHGIAHFISGPFLHMMTMCKIVFEIKTCSFLLITQLASFNVAEFWSRLIHMRVIIQKLTTIDIVQCLTLVCMVSCNTILVVDLLKTNCCLEAMTYSMEF